MNLKITFCVDKSRITFFSKLLKKENKINFENSKKELLYVEKLWNNNYLYVHNVFGKIFKNNFVGEIKVNIFPQYFYLGATETSSKLILFGQPYRTENFPLAIIAHEICHIFLSKFKIPQMINEIICYMVEDCMYVNFDNKSLAEIWKKDKLDLFHLQAISTAIDEIENRGSIVNRSVREVIDYLMSELDDDILDVKPPSGLVKNIIS